MRCNSVAIKKCRANRAAREQPEGLRLSGQNTPNLPTPSHRAAGATGRPNGAAREQPAGLRLSGQKHNIPNLSDTPPRAAGAASPPPCPPGFPSALAEGCIPTVPPPTPQTLAPQHPPKHEKAILRNEPKPVPSKPRRHRCRPERRLGRDGRIHDERRGLHAATDGGSRTKRAVTRPCKGAVPAGDRVSLGL
jgi:hypothetical protein